jgi:hypothetical protein
MFTLKLFKRQIVDGTHVSANLITKIIPTHHVNVMEIGTAHRLLELQAYPTQRDDGEAQTFYIGEREEGMDAITDENHFGWGLLENMDAKTTQHFRPASFG